MPQVISALVVMGVTACGKSTIAEAVAQRSAGVHIEGDKFHSMANIQKMRQGSPLTDADRAPWLARLGQELAAAVRAGERPVLSCSALKRQYRDQLRAAVPGLSFVFLDLEQDEVVRRVARRQGHFVSVELVDSQFAALERPTGEAGVLTVDGTLPVAEISRQVVEWWQESGALGMEQQGS